MTREQFLFYEIRTVASLQLQGLNREEIVEEIKRENLFQFPTERMISSIAGACFKRIDALGSETLVYYLANAPAEVAKQINLYAMMKYNRLVWDFMVDVYDRENGSGMPAPFFEYAISSSRSDKSYSYLYILLLFLHQYLYFLDIQ